MNKIAIAFVATAALFGFACKKSAGNEALGKIEGFSKSMCECKDKGCADKVNDEYTKWGTEMAKTAKPEDAKSVDAETTKKMTDAATKYTECYTKLAVATPPVEEKKADPATPPAEEKKADPATPPAEEKKEPAAEEKPAAKADEKPAAKADEKKSDEKKGGW